MSNVINKKKTENILSEREKMILDEIYSIFNIDKHATIYTKRISSNIAEYLKKNNFDITNGFEGDYKIMLRYDIQES